MIYTSKYKEVPVDVHDTYCTLVELGQWKMEWEIDTTRFIELTRVFNTEGFAVTIVFEEFHPIPPAEGISDKIYDIEIVSFDPGGERELCASVKEKLAALCYHEDEWHSRFKEEQPYLYNNYQPYLWPGYQESGLDAMPSYLQSIVLEDLRSISFGRWSENPFTNHLKKDILYPPHAMQDFYLTAYEYIDNLNHTVNPADCVEDHELYIDIARRLFLEAGWAGDGAIKLMWIPPFMLHNTDGFSQYHNTYGTYVWHVKQKSDGISWLLSPYQLF